MLQSAGTAFDANPSHALRLLQSHRDGPFGWAIRSANSTYKFVAWLCFKKAACGGGCLCLRGADGTLQKWSLAPWTSLDRMRRSLKMARITFRVWAKMWKSNTPRARVEISTEIKGVWFHFCSSPNHASEPRKFLLRITYRCKNIVRNYSGSRESQRRKLASHVWWKFRELHLGPSTVIWAKIWSSTAHRECPDVHWGYLYVPEESEMADFMKLIACMRAFRKLRASFENNSEYKVWCQVRIHRYEITKNI